MDAVFKKAADPDSFHCLGARLKPLTIGHLFALNKYCPDAFLYEPDRGTLAVACFICAHDPRTIQRLLRWPFVTLTRLMFILWARMTARLDIKVEYDKWYRFVRHNMEPPNLWRDLSDPLTSCQSPTELRLLVMLLCEFHYSETEALAMTVLKANAMWAAIGELRGKFKLSGGQRIETLLEYADRMDSKDAEKNNN